MQSGGGLIALFVVDTSPNNTSEWPEVMLSYPCAPSVYRGTLTGRINHL